VTVVLLHGVPETPALWDPIRRVLDRDDIVTPFLPGFGAPRPDGFGATKEEYADWLIGEMEALGEPVDLVGHDWGAGLVARLVSLRPDLARSWVIDAGGLAHESFEWHEAAKIWQTPGAGEEFWEGFLAMPVDQLAVVLQSFGVPAEGAPSIAAGLDSTMVGCILDLYRSAVHIGKEWGVDFKDVPSPGLVLVPSEDPYQSAGAARAGATQTGASVADLDGLGHWWMLEDPGRGADVLRRFWAGLD
jgi:pimeloyl-ACP methyl ester carboxylesterase